MVVSLPSVLETALGTARMSPDAGSYGRCLCSCLRVAGSLVWEPPETSYYPSSVTRPAWCHLRSQSCEFFWLQELVVRSATNYVVGTGCIPYLKRQSILGLQEGGEDLWVEMLSQGREKHATAPAPVHPHKSLKGRLHTVRLSRIRK